MPVNRNRNLSRVRETRTVPPCTAEALIAREEPMRQNQLLVDLLGAVNSLTAAILSGKNKS